MKTVQQMTFGVALALLMAVQAVAQSDPEMTMPWSAQQTASDNDYYAVAQGGTSAAPAEKPATSAKPDAATSDDSAKGDEEEKPSCRWCVCGKLGDPWTLPQPDCLKERSITVGGWLSGGIYANQYGTRSNGPVGLRDEAGEFTADQLWMFAERKTDTKGCGWDLGGRVDYVFGADGPDTQAFGDRSWDWGWCTSNDRVYGSAIPQAYAEIAHNDVKVKVGHFYTPIGYEVVQAPQNFFYSHSYSHTFGEPFTHTGALAAYTPNEKVTYYGGWVDGWDEGFADYGGGSMFLGGISLTLSEKATLAWYVSTGKFGNGVKAFSGTGVASGNLYYNCIIFTYKLTDKWTYVLEHDLGSNYDVDPRVGVDNQWYEVNNYLTYKVNDCLSYGGRFEWFQDPQGARVVAGDSGNYYAVTAGINWKPHANVTIRPEIRYDGFSGDAPAGGLPFHNGESSSQLAFGTDFIFTY
jgi:hypothetical protein